MVKLINLKSKGQSLFEVIIAIGVTSVILVAIINTAILSVRNTSFSRNKTLASRYVQESLEWLRSERDDSWDSFSAKSSLTWCLSDLSWDKNRSCSTTDNITGTPFKRELVLTSVSNQQISAKIRVYWTDNQGYHEANAVTYLTDWRIIK